MPENVFLQFYFLSKFYSYENSKTNDFSWQKDLDILSLIKKMIKNHKYIIWPDIFGNKEEYQRKLENHFPNYG